MAEALNSVSDVILPHSCWKGLDDASSAAIYEVVGGGANGGIVVRSGKSTASPQAEARLATGARVRAVAVDGDRLCYELLSGSGPQCGWVSLRVAGKPLLLPAAQEKSANDRALLEYSKRLQSSLAEDGARFNFARCAFPWQAAGRADGGSTGLDTALRAELEASVAAAGEATSQQPEPMGTDEACDSDGERLTLCRGCRLPLGPNAYCQEDQKGRKVIMHAECMAQAVSADMLRSEAARKSKEARLKKLRREEFDIGWRPAMIPDNGAAGAKLACDVAPHGLCCLVLQEDGSLRVAPTLEPAAALNLEYLSLALKVRRAEGREPLFSLDPVDAAQSSRGNAPEASMQQKRFEPEWLAGTSLGEVMFQADYHLKELSMGEHGQPVVGMKSCLERSESEGVEKEWSAREWFVVRQAEIQVSEDSVLVPFLKMGVEAREQFIGPDGLEDAPLTRENHPLVTYAAAFTQNFDLIAERKSVVSQLREVAKATVIAKLILESGLELDERWFGLGDLAQGSCCLEVPQLWNDRAFSKIRVQDGAIACAEKGDDRIHGVYGGVDFGIDRFRLAPPSRVASSVVAGRAPGAARPASTLMATMQAGASLAPTRQFSRLTAPSLARAAAPGQLAAPVSSRLGFSQPYYGDYAPYSATARPASSLMAATSRMSATSRVSLAAPMVARPTAPTAPFTQLTAARPASSLMAATSRLGAAAPSLLPRGVDLNLDHFNLSSVLERGSWQGTLLVPDDLKDLSIGGPAFWKGLSGSTEVFREADRALLLSIFHPSLSDRQSEGPAFTPPSTSSTYLSKLRSLIKAEETVREQRLAHFLSLKFSPENAGPLFPLAWASAVSLETGAGERLLQPRPELLAQGAWLEEAIGTSAPVFEKRTEDGTAYSIYRLGSLEVRATTALGGRRTIGAVFSVAGARAAAGGAPVAATEKVLKVTEYVEKSDVGRLRSHYYLALRTTGGHTIISEVDRSGRLVWSENPSNAEDRHALAKVLRSADCGGRNLAAGAVRDLAAEAGGPRRPGLSASVHSKQHARGLFSRLTGRPLARLQNTM